MRLSEIDPEQLAATEWRHAVDKVRSRLLTLAPLSTYSVDMEEDADTWRASIYGLAVYALARYARHGTPLDASVHEYCVSLVGAGDGVLDDSRLPHPSTPLGLVVAGALARERLGTRGGKVTASELAILASVSDDHVRLLARKGEVELVDGEIKGAFARRWLGARGVAGFAETK